MCKSYHRFFYHYEQLTLAPITTNVDCFVICWYALEASSFIVLKIKVVGVVDNLCWPASSVFGMYNEIGMQSMKKMYPIFLQLMK